MDTQNFQDLQEISKKLLGSYVSKAGEDLRRNKNKEFLKRGDAEYHDSGSRRSGPNPELAAKAREDAKTYSDKASRRAKGLAIAGKKIANESTLREYVNNVVKSIFEDLETRERKGEMRAEINQAVKTTNQAGRAYDKAWLASERSKDPKAKELHKKTKGEYLKAQKTEQGLVKLRNKELDSPKLYGKSGKVVKEDVFDSPTSASASRANVKKATKTLGASSPHTKALTKLHGDIKKSRHMYGISDDELDRQADAKYSDMEFSDVPAPKPTLTPMKGKAWDGYDASIGRGDKKVNLGVIKKVAAAIKNKSKGK